MASEKQRKQDLCVLAISHQLYKTLSIERAWILAKLVTKSNVDSSNITCLKIVIYKV